MKMAPSGADCHCGQAAELLARDLLQHIDRSACAVQRREPARGAGQQATVTIEGKRSDLAVEFGERGAILVTRAT